MRHMPKPDAPEAFRVVLEHRTADDSSTYMTEYLGPYTSLASARGQSTTALRYAMRGGRTARARIESSTLTWAVVEATR